eukprot:TRINITY_DN123067_c0_g1_i1.p1 TRINITY_DN123067_c0_g1~~TRINITY_DN123067_c0_g1_i1.p1  ORF type:complete len:614 (+),score=47.84 TRINITY_DN123067_c0_g1_i1:71-1912(+)
MMRLVQLILCWAFVAPTVATHPEATAACGRVRGTEDPASGAAAFLGIPYALPPTGSRRWQPPIGVGTSQEEHRAGCWTGVLDATTPGPACLQAGEYSKSGQASSEDCLRLHVHTKNLQQSRRSDGSLKPVLVWFHGGGLLEGSPFAIQSGFGAQANLTSDNDVVVVSVQYRIGVAGFLSLASLSSYHDPRKVSGNYGLLDGLEALKWIHANVAAFGGDPHRVTIWGQSSGGSMVLAILASPRSRGLVHGGVSMSGSPHLNSTTSEAAEYWHREVVARTRCSSIGFAAKNEARLADCLLQLPAEDLLNATPANWHSDVWSLGLFNATWQYAPILLIDGPGGVLPKGYLNAFDVKENAQVPLILGVTSEESDFSPGEDVRTFSQDALVDLLRKTIGHIQPQEFVSQIAAAYGLGTSTGGSFEPQRVYAQILSDVTTVCPNLYLASVIDAQEFRHAVPTYAYIASRHLDDPFCVLEPFNKFRPPYCPLYSFHAADEFAMLQPAYSSKFPYKFTDADIAYGRRLRKRILEFTATGSVRAWSRVINESRYTGEPRQLGAGKSRSLPSTYSMVNLGEQEANLVNLKRAQCDLWLQAGFYDSRGLVNMASPLTPTSVMMV